MSKNYDKEGQIRLQAVIDAAVDVIITIDKRGVIQTCNIAIQKIFGYLPSDVIGKNVSILMPTPFKEEHDQYLERYSSTKVPRIIGIGRQVVAQRKDKSVFHIHLSVSEFKLENEVFYTGIIYDLTEIKNVQSELKNANSTLEELLKDRTDELSQTINKLLMTNKRLKSEIDERKKIESKLRIRESEIKIALDKERELNDLKSRFVSIASHEFRTPMSVILSSISLVKRYTKEEEQPKREKHIEKIQLAINTLTGILEDFLFYSKTEEGKLELNPTEFNWQDFVQNFSEEITMLLKPEQQVIHNHLQKTIPLFMDEGMLNHALINLISNASKYSENGKEIHFSSEIKSDFFTIEIKDFGIGIPKDDQDYLFTRFFRATNVQNIKGTGLGLSIVKNYIEQLHGSIEFESEYEKGSVFTIKIPVKYNISTSNWQNI